MILWGAVHREILFWVSDSLLMTILLRCSTVYLVAWGEVLWEWLYSFWATQFEVKNNAFGRFLNLSFRNPQPNLIYVTILKHDEQQDRLRLTIFSSNGLSGFCLAMSSPITVSADGTFIWPPLHLVRWCWVRWAIAHLVVAVKAAGLALWLILMGLDGELQRVRTCTVTINYCLDKYSHYSNCSPRNK